MTTKSEAKGSKTLMGMKQTSYDTKKGAAGKDTGESVRDLAETTKDDPNS
jgi:hypothetical protein